MTLRSRTLISLLIAFTLAAPLTGCSADAGSSGGTGALGDAPAGPANAPGDATDPPVPELTPTVPPPDEDTPEEEIPEPGGTLTLGPPPVFIDPGSLEKREIPDEVRVGMGRYAE